MNKLILLSIILSLTGCASVTPQQESARNALQEKHFYKYDSHEDFFQAIEKNNLAAIKLYLASRDSYPYSSNTDREDLETIGWYAMERALNKPPILTEFLKFKVTQQGAKDMVWSEWKVKCPESRDEIFEALLKYGGSPKNPSRAAHKLVNNGCVDELKRYLALYPAGARGFYTDSYTRFGIRYDANDGSSTIDKKKYDNYLQIGAILREGNERECQAKVLEACKANSELNEYMIALKSKYDLWVTEEAKRKVGEAEFEAEAKKQEKDEASGKYDFDRACGALNQIEFDKRIIADEKKITAQSGVVNKAVLYETTRRLQADYGFLDHLKKEYKKKSGKAFNPKDCGKDKQ